MSAVCKSLRLSVETIDALAEQVAERVAERLREDGIAATLVSAAEVARRFGVSRDYVYDHASELGAVRLGDGGRAPLRFDPQAVADRLAAAASPPSSEEHKTKRTRRRKPASRVPLLPVREGDDPPTRHRGTGERSARNRAHAQTADLPGGDHG